MKNMTQRGDRECWPPRGSKIQDAQECYVCGKVALYQFLPPKYAGRPKKIGVCQIHRALAEERMKRTVAYHDNRYDAVRAHKASRD